MANTPGRPTPNGASRPQTGGSRPNVAGNGKQNVPSTGDHGHDDGHDDGHHLVPASTFYRVFGALICLTVITVGISRIDLGFFNDIAAFGIATVKAGLVLSIFMHLKYDDMMNRVIIGCSFFFLLVLYFFSEIDQVTRIVYQSHL